MSKPRFIVRAGLVFIPIRWWNGRMICEVQFGPYATVSDAWFAFVGPTPAPR